MRYRLKLGGREIKTVISVTETLRNDINEYHSLNGKSYCAISAKPLRCWEIELLSESSKLTDYLRDMRDDQKAERLTVYSAAVRFSARVTVSEMRIENGCGDSAVILLRLLEYKKAAAGTADGGRAGSIAKPPERVSAGNAYQLIVQYQDSGENLRVANPNTGAEVSNLAAVNPDMLLRVERCKEGEKSAALNFEEKKNKIISRAYDIIAKLK